MILPLVADRSVRDGSVGRPLVSFSDRDGQVTWLAAADHPRRCCLADAIRPELGAQVISVADRLAAKAHQHIPQHQAGPFSGPARLDADDE